MQNRTNVCTPTESASIGLFGSDVGKKVRNTTDSANFSLAAKTSSKNDAGKWECRTDRNQREAPFSTNKDSVRQRLWEIRVDSVLNLDRSAKRESNDDIHVEAPR